jgi:hypothetical protein
MCPNGDVKVFVFSVVSYRRFVDAVKSVRMQVLTPLVHYFNFIEDYSGCISIL